MDNAGKLAMLKVMLGISAAETSVDADLTVYLTLSASKILRKAFPYDYTVTIVPTQYETLQCEIAAYLWNKRGAEGETYHSENGINRSYENADVPESMLKPVIPFVEVI